MCRRADLLGFNRWSSFPTSFSTFWCWKWAKSIVWPAFTVFLSRAAWHFLENTKKPLQILPSEVESERIIASRRAQRWHFMEIQHQNYDFTWEKLCKKWNTSIWQNNKAETVWWGKHKLRMPELCNKAKANPGSQNKPTKPEQIKEAGASQQGWNKPRKPEQVNKSRISPGSPNKPTRLRWTKKARTSQQNRNESRKPEQSNKAEVYTNTFTGIVKKEDSAVPIALNILTA